MSKIFISHSSKDNAKALALADWLDQNGWGEYFLDITPKLGLSPGERWQEALKTATDRCEAVLFLISPNWRDSKWCLAEFLLAKQLGKSIFGVIIEPTPIDSLPREMTVQWQICDLVAGTERILFQVQQDPIVPPTEVTFARAGLTGLKHGLQKAGLDPLVFPWPPPNDPNRLPYRGLKALDIEDAAVFFGREAALIRGLDTLRRMDDRGEHVFVILGASGAGKSSFLRAGLWPRLKRDDRHFLPLPVIRPERAAISGQSGLLMSLERAFRDYNAPRTRAQLRTALTKSNGALGIVADLQALAQKALGQDADPPTVVFPIDQGEELFTKEGIAEAQLLLDLLGNLVTQSKGDGESVTQARLRIIIIVAIRSDSYEYLQTAPAIAGVRQTPFSLPPLAQSEYKMVIEGPAARSTAAGLRLIVKPDLTEQLLKDAEGADALPLLAFILERLLIEHGSDGDLRLDEYDSLGGLKGSIEAAVTEAFRDPDRVPVIPADEASRIELLGRIFPSLVTLDQDTEQPKRLVATWDALQPEAHPLLERLIEARLLLQDQRLLSNGQQAIIVEVAHEALLRQWGALTTWLKLEGANVRMADSVRRATVDWLKAVHAHKAHTKAWLVHGGEALRDAEHLQNRFGYDCRLGPAEREYLMACKEKEEKARAENDLQLVRTARAQRRIKALLSIITTIILLAGFWIFTETKDVAYQRSLVLASEASKANENSLYGRGLRFSILAARGFWLPKSIPEVEVELLIAANAYPLLAQFEGHKAAVYSAVFSPDGRQVVTASVDNTAQLWDAATGKVLATLTGHRDAVYSAAFSPDGRQVVTVSEDKTARLWETATAKALATLTGHEQPVYSAAFSPDGRQVVTVSGDKTARLWETATGRALATLHSHEHPLYSVAFTPNGQQFVTVSGETARLWETATGKALVTFMGHKREVYSAALSPDGRQVVTASGDKTARLWETATGKALVTFTGHSNEVYRAAFSPDGRQVVTASKDKTARLWETATGEELATLTGHEGFVTSAAFSPDGRRILTASADNTARSWEPTRGKALNILTGHEQPVYSVAFSADGRHVVTASGDKTARLWETATGRALATLTGHEEMLESAAFSPDGRQVVTASKDKTARLWETATGRALTILTGHEDVVESAVFSPDGRQVVTASRDKTARLWETATGKALATLTGHEDKVVSALFSPDGRQVVTASRDKTARLWETATGKALVTFTGHDNDVYRAAFSPNGRQVVTASMDDTARLWETATGKRLATLTGHNSPVISAVFSPDGRQVLTASMDDTARLWETATGKVLVTFMGHTDVVSSAVFSPDGRQVLTASRDDTARVWETATGKRLATLTGHKGNVNSAAFSPDRRQVITASGDNTARIWDIHWITQYHGADLINAVCREKLIGDRVLSGSDMLVSPLLNGRGGEDVCASASAFSRLISMFN